MRFYLNVPLVAGYTLMAITACLGMFQFVAARGGYAGLSLFTSGRRNGTFLGASLTVGALLAYVAFAPEILTPGPAGTEVAEMFAICALSALIITLIGSDVRLQRIRHGQLAGGDRVMLADLAATMHNPIPTPVHSERRNHSSVPAVVIFPDPTGFAVTPAEIVNLLLHSKVAVLAIDANSLAKSPRRFSRLTLLGHLSVALVHLAEETGIDPNRIGLLGVGLGGDVVLHAAALDSRIKSCVAVSPTLLVQANSGLINPSIDWLRELSYRQIWRWRRNSVEIQNTISDLIGSEPHQQVSVVKSSIVLGGAALITTRIPELRGQIFSIPVRRHFALLEDSQALDKAVSWLEATLFDGQNQDMPDPLIASETQSSGIDHYAA